MPSSGALRVVHPMPGWAQTELRQAAMEFATQRWPVMPGTYPTQDGWRGKRGATGLSPVVELWSLAATTDSRAAEEWWTHRPYTVLLQTGMKVDAVEFDRVHLPAIQEALRVEAVRAPLAQVPWDRCLLFVEATTFSDADRDRAGRVVWHRGSSWVPLPPTTARPGYPCQWRVRPSECGWELPGGEEVRRVLARVFPTDVTASSLVSGP